MRAPGWARTRRGRRRALWAVMALCVLALLPSAWIRVASGGAVRDEADVDPAPVAVVFGAGLRDGRPSPYLAHRLDVAARLYAAGRVSAVLVTGDHGRAGYDEPTAMRDYLARAGVPGRQVVWDHAGFDTWDSCVRARRVFGVDRAVLVSQGFHIRRAVALCRAAGVEAQGVAARDPRDVTWYYGASQEILAAPKAALDALVHRTPVLGPRERDLRDAVARGRG
ncbi:SanA/YdcF family protein [Streptomyces sp. SPB074]|uniref:SanA/YdcF family protein n=1 Tax=Streptomyces sp. (strain SPB074) TaxID=465543 RepID=UPI00017F2734|nr:ElyC/SanA/YdcF family protein [Streptomyces sp. SPB074]